MAGQQGDPPEASPVVEAGAEAREGVEVEDTSITEITDPFDPEEIRIRSMLVTGDLLASRLSHGEIDLAPDYQRTAGIWDRQRQSRLIESLLMRIPVPSFYFDGTNEDRWVVIDGLQRLWTLTQFVVTGKLRLAGMEFLNTLNGMSFADLARPFQRRILETQFTCYIVSPGTPEDVKFKIFSRINTGGVPLSAQEIRNALHTGPVTDFLRRLAGSEEFLAATDRGVRETRMADRECVLRFFAFRDGGFGRYQERDFDAFLSEAMEALNGQVEQHEELDRRFRRAMRLAAEMFGQTAFRKVGLSQHRAPVNRPLFEVWSVNLDALDDAQAALAVERRQQIQDRLKELLRSDQEFVDAISFSTGDARKVRKRFEAVGNLLAECLR